jgi:serine/threonine-protein kinase
VAAGLSDNFVVTSTPSPAPHSPPTSAVGGGLADTFVTSAAQRASAVPPRPTTPAAGAPSVNPFGTFATPAPSAPINSSRSSPTAQGLVLRVVVSDEKGKTLGDFACNSVTRAGLIVVTSGPFPPLLSRVKLVFADVNGLSCDAQVVHHVTPDQAMQWKMSPGYGVQFVALSPEQRTMLESAHQGLKLPETPSGLAKRPDDPAAEEVLRRYSAERANDAYAMLSISKAAPFDAIRDRVRDARRNLETLNERPLSLGQQKALADARARIEDVGKTLCEAEARLEYDAGRGNFEGVARCISAGISVAQLEAARIRFLKSHPGVEAKTPGNLLAAQTLEARQQMAQALDAYADTLRLDPLNLMAQQRYWAVRRQLDNA